MPRKRGQNRMELVRMIAPRVYGNRPWSLSRWEGDSHTVIATSDTSTCLTRIAWDGTTAAHNAGATWLLTHRGSTVVLTAGPKAAKPKG